MIPKLFFSALLFSALLFSCRNAEKKHQMQDISISNLELKDPAGQDKSQEMEKSPLGDFKNGRPDTITVPVPAQSAAHTDWDKKIIKTATVKLEVGDFKKYNGLIHTTIRKYGGYIAQEQQNFTGEKSETMLSLKVPVEQFETMMNELAAADTKVIDRIITSEDVTGEIIDIRSRLEAKKQVRLKYLDFLKASKNMEEVLKVQSEINDIQEEIEAAAGRIEYLSHQSAYSTINLTFYQPVEGYQPTDNNPSFVNRVSNAFKSGAQWISDLFIAIISIWPLLLIFTGGLFAFKRIKFLKTNPQKS